MKLKYIVAALGLVASASSFAEIIAPSVAGGGELFLVVYQEGTANGGAEQSYALDLGITTSQFFSSKSSVPQTWATLTSSDSVWTNFLATSYVPSLQYAVIGAQSTSSSAAQATSTALFSTVKAGDEALVTGVTTNAQLSTFIGGTIGGYIANVNASPTGNHTGLGSVANGESVDAKGTAAYFQTQNMATFNGGTVKFANNNAVGTSAEFTSLYRLGAATAKAPESIAPGLVSFAKTGNDYVLSYNSANVSPVPEASGFAMALAGFGLMGFVAVRRKQK